MKLSDKVQRDRLFRNVEHSRRQLRPFREDRVELIKQYAGSKYGAESPKRDVLVNLLNQTAELYTLSLAAQRPRVMVNTRKSEYAPFAANFQVAINNLIQEIELESTLRQAVLDAFFSIGIVKVSRGDSVVVQLEGWPLIDPGYPFAECVSLDNWVHDNNATEWWRVSFAGDTYRVPFASVEEDERFDKSVVKQLTPSSKYANHKDGDELAQRISQGWEVDSDEFEPMCDLIDLYLPKDQVIATFACDQYGSFTSDKAPLAVLEWEGPEEGPYHILSFSDVPDNIMPVSPGSQLMALHLLTNALMRKLAKQAKNQKTTVGYQAGAEDDAARLGRAVDMQFVQMKRPDALKVMSFNGADPGNQGFTEYTRNWFSRMAGNLDAWAGLGPQSGTVGQDQIIQAQVGKKEAKMQYRVVDFASRLCRSLGWQLWDDQILQLPGEMQIPGTDLSVRSDWGPEDREGSFLDYNFDVAPYSMAYQSPSEQMNAMTGAVLNVFMPLAQTPFGQQQGLSIDVKKLAEQMGELLNMPRLKEIVKFDGIPPENPSEVEQNRPAVTRRESVRRSIPGGESPEMQMQELMTRARQNGQQGMMQQ